MRNCGVFLSNKVLFLWETQFSTIYRIGLVLNINLYIIIFIIYRIYIQQQQIHYQNNNNAEQTNWNNFKTHEIGSKKAAQQHKYFAN